MGILTKRRAGILFGSGLAVFLAVWLWASPIYAACTLTQDGDLGSWFHGGSQLAPTGTTATFIDSVLWNYNPDPVRRASTFWVMLSRAGTPRWAQVGWVKWGPLGNDPTPMENFFLQYQQDDGTPVTRYLNCNSNVWQTTPACEPVDAKPYQVSYNTTTDKFTMRVNGFAAFTTEALQWIPTAFENFGEIKDGDQSSPNTNQGKDHSPGDTSNKIHSENVLVAWTGSGGIVGANLDYTPFDDQPEITMQYQKVEPIPGWPAENYFRIWDNRCSS